MYPIGGTAENEAAGASTASLSQRTRTLAAQPVSAHQMVMNQEADGETSWHRRTMTGGSMKRMYIALGVTGDEKRVWSGHFGMAPLYLIFDRKGKLVEKRSNPYGAGRGKKKHHDDPELIAGLLPECGVFVARRAGEASRRILAERLGVEVFITDARVPEDAVDQFLANK
jgi:hypothetical protein